MPFRAHADDVPALLSTIRGPWALLYWRPNDQTLWFGRDVMGEFGIVVGLEVDRIVNKFEQHALAITNKSAFRG